MAPSDCVLTPAAGSSSAGGGHDFLERVGADKIAGLKKDEYSNTLYSTGSNT